VLFDTGSRCLTDAVLDWCRVRQILNLFLALLLSAFSSENMKKGQQQQQPNSDGVDDNDADEARTSSESQLTAAYERVGRWVMFVAARVSELTRRRRATPVTDCDDEGDGASKEATSTADVACNQSTAAGSPDTACRRSSRQPALLVDCTDGQVYFSDAVTAEQVSKK